MNKIRILFIALLFGPSLLFGQAPQQTLSTPSADQKFLPGVNSGNTSLGSIYSPSLFDGSANINIPLYDYSNDYGGFGISLSYNTKGITVDETSGPAGTHFNVNCSGTISRQSKDIPDDLHYDMNVQNPNQTIKMRGRLFTYALTTPAPGEYWDAENDDYVVSAGSLQFTFKLGKNGYIFTHPQRRAKIEIYLNGTAYVPSSASSALLADYYGFRITDEQGSQYYFEVSDRSTQMVEDGDPTPGTGGSYEYTSKWVLKKIVFANGQQITYDYIGTTYPTLYNLYRSVSAREAASGAKPSSASFVTVDQFLPTSTILKAVHYPNNVTATFQFDQTDPTNGAGCSKSIKELVISSADQCLRYRFNKSYLLSDQVNSTDLEFPFDQSCNFARISDRRMILKGIDILSCDGTKSEPYYTFEYNSVKLPPRLSGKRDHYGYNNGASGAGVLGGLPLHTHAFNAADVYGENRDYATNEAIISAGNLYKVNNAYGGSLTFQYELHSGIINVMNGLPVSDNKFLGKDADDGVRLKAITESDKFHPGHTRTTRFFYSGGQRFLAGGYYAFPSHITGSNIDEYTVLNSWVSPHQLINGSNHGYSQVITEVRDATTALLSETIYNYSNFYDNGTLRYLLNGSANPANAKNYYQAPFTDKQYIKDWEMGLPVKITQFDQDSMMISRTTNHYRSNPDAGSAIGLGKNIKIMRASPPTNLAVNILTLPILAIDTTLPYTGIALLDTSITEKFINDNTIVTDTVTYAYDNRNNHIITRTRNSRGQYIYTRNVYNYEVSGPGIIGGGQTGTDLYNMTLNGIEKVVSTERWKEMPGTQPSSNRLLDASITGYRYQGTKLRLNQLQNLESLAPMTYAAYTNGNAVYPYSKILAVYNTTQPVSNLKQATEVQRYDSMGNPLETKLLDEEVYKAMLWDSISGKKMAEVSNARYADIGCTSFENTIYGVAYTGSENIANGNFYYKQSGVSIEDSVTGSYCYKLGSVGPSAVVSSAPLTVGKEYLITFWAKNGTPTLSGAGLANIPLTGGYVSLGWTFYQARFTPTAATAVTFTTGSLLFLDELRLMPSGSTMNSWTYNPLFGVKTNTDATGRVNRFEYDPLGRPNATRDQDGNILSKTEFHVSQ